MPKPTSTKGKGKGLKKKLGPFPTYVWLLIVGVILVYFYYRHRQSSQNSATSQFTGSLNQQSIPSGVISPTGTSGSTGSTDSGSSTTSSPTTYPYDYVTNTDLQSALQNQNDQIAASIAAITFPQPNVNITVPQSSVHSSTTASKTAAKKAAAPTSKTVKYYTYKKNVPLRAGQKLHFAKGKGYYAA